MLMEQHKDALQAINPGKKKKGICILMLWVITAFEDDFNKQVFEILLLHCNG